MHYYQDEQSSHGHGPGLSTNVQPALENPHPQWQADEQVPRHISSIQQEPPSYSIDDLDAPLPNSGEPLLPTRLMLHNFGSRFLPHTTSQIRTVLPLLGDRFLLIGHDEGLSVLDMIPSGNPETSGPPDAEIHAIWEGEGYVFCALVHPLNLNYIPRAEYISSIYSNSRILVT